MHSQIKHKYKIPVNEAAQSNIAFCRIKQAKHIHCYAHPDYLSLDYLLFSTTFVFNKAPLKLSHTHTHTNTHTVWQRETAMRAHTHERTIPKQDAIWWQKSLANQARLCGVTWNENSIYRNLVVFEINRIALRRLD